MRAREILNEISMPINKPFGGNTNTTFGFEAEFIIPADRRFAEIHVEDFRDLKDYLEDSTIHKLSLAFEDWKEKQDDNEYMDEDDWLNDEGLSGILKSLGEYEVQTRFPYRYGDGQFGDEKVLLGPLDLDGVVENACDNFHEDVGEQLHYTGQKITDGNDYTEWTMELEPSARDYEEFSVGLEIVSPIIRDYDAFKTKLSQVLNWINFEGFEVNGTTGLHINIGVDKSKLDPLKLLIFAGEKWLQKNWPRDSDEYTAQLIPKIIAGLPINPVEANKHFREEIRRMMFGLTTAKDHLIGFHKLERLGFIEFRAIGGHNYTNRLDEINQNIDRFMRLIEIASDPNLYVREYQAKLAKLILGQNEPSRVLSSRNTEERVVAKWLEQIDHDQEGMYSKFVLNHVQDKDGRIIIHSRALVELAASLDIPQPVLRVLVKHAKLTRDELEKYSGQILSQYGSQKERALRQLSPFV